MHIGLKQRKVSDPVGAVLPKDVLAYSSAREGGLTSPTNTADGTSRASPTKPEVARQFAVARDVMHRYRHTLRELAQ